MRNLTIENIYDYFSENYFQSEENNKELFIAKITHDNSDARSHAENIWFCLVDLIESRETPTQEKQVAYYEIIESSLNRINQLTTGAFVEMINEERDRGTSNSINL